MASSSSTAPWERTSGSTVTYYTTYLFHHVDGQIHRLRGTRDKHLSRHPVWELLVNFHVGVAVALSFYNIQQHRMGQGGAGVITYSGRNKYQTSCAWTQKHDTEGSSDITVSILPGSRGRYCKWGVTICISGTLGWDTREENSPKTMVVVHFSTPGIPRIQYPVL